MSTWLIHYSFDSRKKWTIIEAKSIQEAIKKIRGNDNVEILQIELCPNEFLNESESE